MVLLWLVPTVVVTVAAMLWVSWLGREGRGEVDREVALQRMAKVLDPVVPRRRWRRRRPTTAVATAAPRPRADRSTGVAVRPSRPARPPQRAQESQPSQPPRPGRPASSGEERRAS